MSPPDDETIDRYARALGPLRPPPTEEFDPDLLLAWRAGALDEAERAAAEALLAADPEARAWLADLEAEPSPFLERWAEAELRGPRHRRAVGLVTALALAAGALFFALRPTPPPDYTVELLRGPQVEHRGEEAPTAELHRVDDEVTLALTLGPTAPLDAAVHGAAFVDGPDGRLQPAAVPGATGEGGSWYIRAPARALFGERHGPRALYVALAYDADDLADLAGRDPPDTETHRGVRWHVLRFDYRRSEDR